MISHLHLISTHFPLFLFLSWHVSTNIFFFSQCWGWSELWVNTKSGKGAGPLSAARRAATVPILSELRLIYPRIAAISFDNLSFSFFDNLYSPPSHNMSYKKAGVYPPNPVTSRGVSTKLSSAKDKIVYTSGRTVLVSLRTQPLNTADVFDSDWFRYAILRFCSRSLIHPKCFGSDKLPSTRTRDWRHRTLGTYKMLLLLVSRHQGTIVLLLISLERVCHNPQPQKMKDGWTGPFHSECMGCGRRRPSSEGGV